jgi:DNA sulfur modification protein DndD
MAEVFIESLTLENFGPYYGEHVFDFRSLEGKCGILIGGKTGAGKTHLLRALYLSVVGEKGVADLRRVESGSEATRFAFEKSLNRRAMAEGQDTVRLKAVISLRDSDRVGSRKLELCREARFRPNSPPVWEHYAVRSDPPGRIEDEQAIQKLRDAFLPRHLARFFFFDAERSQNINLSEEDIVEGVSRILGYHTYSELEGDLRHVISTKIPRAFNSSGGPDPETLLAELNGRVITVDGTLRARRKEREALQRDLHGNQAELMEIEDDLKTLGAVDPVELAKAQARNEELTQAKTKLQTKLQDAWELVLPVSLLAGYRRQLHDALFAEERRREWESAKSTVEPKIPQVTQDVFGNQPTGLALTPAVRDFYMKRLVDALNRLFHPPPQGMPETCYIADRNDISAQVRGVLATPQRELQDLAEMCLNIEKIDIEWREINQKLKQMQQDTAAFKRGAELHENRGKLLAENERISKRLAEVEAEITRMEVELADLKRQETTQREIAEKAERGENLAALASRYIEAAGEIRSRAAIAMRKEIAREVGRLWVEIAEREREFDGMEFDSHWQCWLVRRDGKKMTWEEANTSAGQRQVRMLAFYEALRRLAKLVPPLVVDTPLARLDKEVRANVLDRLYLSGHQSIILSTNAEIDPDGPLFDEVRDRLARVYTLHPHGKPDSTNYEVRVTSNYFGYDL